MDEDDNGKFRLERVLNKKINRYFFSGPVTFQHRSAFLRMVCSTNVAIVSDAIKIKGKIFKKQYILLLQNIV